MQDLRCGSCGKPGDKPHVRITMRTAEGKRLMCLPCARRLLTVTELEKAAPSEQATPQEKPPVTA